MQTVLNLFDHVLESYQACGGRLRNEELYRDVVARADIDEDALLMREPIGKTGQSHNVLKRRIRWYQQDLKEAKILKRVEGERGIWELTEPAGKKLHRIQTSIAVIGYSTDLGVCLLGSCDTVFGKARLDTPISLVLTSPPFPLARPRDYGNVKLDVYTDWLCRMLEPVIENLAEGASLCLNLSPDIFLPGMPARSTYCERMVIALEDRFGLFLMDRLIWENTSRPPGPYKWASETGQQLNSAYDFVFWMTNCPKKARSNNRNVLREHTERHLKLMRQGGEKREGVYAGGAYTIRHGSYGNETEGAIPKNILRFSHNCKDQREYKRRAREMDLPVHTAPMPISLPSFLIKLLTAKEEVVADPFAGSGTTLKAAENLGRCWIGSEIMAESVIGASTRFETCNGFQHFFGADWRRGRPH